MPTLSAPDLVKLRTGQQAARLYLSVYKPTTLLTALINEPSAVPGQREIDYDGGTGTGFSLIEGGQPLIFNGRKVRIKSITGNQTSGTITLAENSEVWADNAVITVQHDYPLFPMLPSFDAETEEFFKDIGTGASGVAYTDENEEPPPVCVVGVQAFVGWFRGTASGVIASQPGESADDGLESASGATIDINDGVMISDATFPWMGIRFPGVTIPQGATVLSGFLSVYVDDVAADDADFNIYAEASASPAVIAATFGNISLRAKTTAFLNWTAAGVGIGTKSPGDILPLVQEVVDSTGIDGALMFIFEGLGAQNLGIVAWDGNPSLAAIINLTYVLDGVVFEVNLTGSYPVAQGATIASYSASAAPAAGITVDLNTGTGVGTITCSAAGQWIVKFGCTDDNGKTQYTYRKVMTDEPYNHFTVGDLSGGWDQGGWAYGVTVSGDATLADFPDEALAVLWAENTIDGAEDYVNIWAEGDAYRGENTLCAGYIQNDQAGDDYETDAGTVSFRVETPESLLATRTDFGSLELEAVANPATWYEYASWLTVGRAIHHHLKWHSTAFEVMDVRGLLDNDYGMRFATFTEASLLQRDNNLSFNNGINAKLICDRLGRLHLARDSQLLGSSERAALDTVFELTAPDVSGQFSTTREPVRRVAQTVANGFMFDGTASAPLLSIAPGNVPENTGTGRINRPGQVLEDQDELNERTGRFHNVANATLTGENVSFRGNYLGAFDIVPSLGFYEWGLVDNTLKRQLALNGQRLICRSVQVSINYEESHLTGAIQVSAVFEWEVEGESGQTDTYPGFPECPPGAGTNRNIEDDPAPGDELADAGAFPPVALMAFSSANYRLLDGSNDWASLAADTTLYGCIDKFWVVKASSYDPANLITWISGAGFIKELFGNVSPVVTVRTPASAPPDTWSDTPDPAAATCSYIQIESDAYNQDEFYTLALFQNGSSLYRGWVGKRLADNTFSWLPLYDTGGSLPTQSRPIFMAITGLHVLVTVWQDLATDKLKLLVFTKSPFAFDSEVDLGDCTLTQLNDRDLLAFPAATPDYSATSPDATAPWYVAGRMDDPAAAFGDIAHVIQFDGATWTEVSLLDADGVAEDWGTDYCGALVVGPDDPAGREYWAARLSP